MTVGLTPTSAADVNTGTGTICRQFVSVRDNAHSQAANLAGIDLTVDPYNMTTADETTIKTAINSLDTALQAVDMTFISRLLGLPIF